MQKKCHKLQSFQGKQKQCQKDAGNCNGDMERIRDEGAEREVQLQELEQQSQRIHSAEAELDEEIRNLQGGDDRRNSCASQSTASLIRPWWSSSSRWEQHKKWQQIQALHEEFHERFEVLHQPSATPVYTSGGDENKEEQTQRAASRRMGQPAPGDRNSVFPAGSVFDPARLSRNVGEDGEESNSP